MYPRYGGRGIQFLFGGVTEAGVWIMEHLGLHKDLEMDRIDNNGHYAPGNLRWATRAQNAANKENSVAPFGWRELSWPYSDFTVARKLRSGMTRESILQDARQAVLQKRKNWRGIAKKLASMT